MATTTVGAVTTINTKEEWTATLGAASNDGKAVRARQFKNQPPVPSRIAIRINVILVPAGGGGLFGDLVRPLPHDLSFF